MSTSILKNCAIWLSEKSIADLPPADIVYIRPAGGEDGQLLPDIIHLLEGLFAEKDEDIVKRNFINNVIPQICNKLYPQIRTNIETSTREVQAAYKSMLDEKLEQLQNSIASIKEQKAQKVETFAAYQGYITEDIAAIQKMLQQLR